jgi:hypothetical protein
MTSAIAPCSRSHRLSGRSHCGLSPARCLIIPDWSSDMPVDVPTTTWNRLLSGSPMP